MIEKQIGALQKNLTAKRIEYGHSMIAEEVDNVNLLWVAILVEGGLILAALSLAWFGCFDPTQPITELIGTNWATVTKWGLVCTLPILGQLFLFHFWQPKFHRPLQRIVDTKLRPLFRNATIFEILVISLLAGLGEELFFRWCLQGGIAAFLTGLIGERFAIALAVISVSFVFGLCHWVNSVYGLTTFVIGIYLGVVMVLTGTWLVPAFSHALFDFIAILYIIRSRPKTPVLDESTL